MKTLHDETLDEKFVSRTEPFSGNLLKVKVDQITLPNGKGASREMILHPGAVGILPVFDDGSMAFVKQYRYPVGSVLYEIPAGKLEPNEDYLECAKRELSEETGLSAGSWTYMTGTVTTPGFTNEVIHLYLAKELQCHASHPDEDEFVKMEVLPCEQVKKMVLEQEIFDAKTLAALLLYFLMIKA